MLLREYTLGYHLGICDAFYLLIEYDIVHKHINYGVADVILLILSFWNYGFLDHSILYSSYYRILFSMYEFCIN